MAVEDFSEWWLGPMGRIEAENRLKACPFNCFLVRLGSVTGNSKSLPFALPKNK